jgi:hypothetical protein
VQMAEFDGLVGMAFEALRYTTRNKIIVILL